MGLTASGGMGILKSNIRGRGAGEVRHKLEKKRFQAILALIAFGVLLYALLQNFQTAWEAVKTAYAVVAPVVTGFCIAFVLNVLLRVLEQHIFLFMKRSPKPWVRRLLRPVSLVATIFLTLGIVVLLMVVIIPELQESILLLVTNLEEYVETIQNWLSGIRINDQQVFTARLDWGKLFDTIQQMLTPGTDTSIVETAAGVTTSVIRSLMNLVFSFFIAIYVLAQKERAGELAMRISRALLPPQAAEKLRRICALANSSFSNFIVGQLTEAVILGVLCFVGMKIFRFPNAAIISVLVGVTAVVPIIGPLIGEIVGCLLILMESPLQALLFLIFVLALQVIEGNVIYPKVVGRSVGLPGVIVLSAVIIGSNLAGITGVLLGVPIASVLYTLVLDWLDNRPKAAKKGGAPRGA